MYYYFWVRVLPKVGKYELRQIILDLGDGATTHKLVKVPSEEIARWDAEHDATGRVRRRGVAAVVVSSTEKVEDGSGSV